MVVVVVSVSVVESVELEQLLVPDEVNSLVLEMKRCKMDVFPTPSGPKIIIWYVFHS